MHWKYIFIEVLSSSTQISAQNFNMSWIEGQLPSTWKSANVTFLRKQGKSDYYSPSSYRPISLTSVLGKLMEGIILARLEAYKCRRKQIAG